MAASQLEPGARSGLQPPADLRRTPFDEVVDVLVDGLFRLIRDRARRRPAPSSPALRSGTAVHGAASAGHRQHVEIAGESS